MCSYYNICSMCHFGLVLVGLKSSVEKHVAQLVYSVVFKLTKCNLLIKSVELPCCLIFQSKSVLFVFTLPFSTKYIQFTARSADEVWHPPQESRAPGNTAMTRRSADSARGWQQGQLPGWHLGRGGDSPQFEERISHTRWEAAGRTVHGGLGFR